MPRGNVAKNNPVRSTRNDLDTNNEKVGQDQARVLRATGGADEALDDTIVQPVERVVSNDKLEALRFMEDELLVMVADTTNETDEPFPEVWNDGTVQRFQRGVEQRVKRKYIEVLARAKKTVFGNERFKQPDGIDAYRYPSHTALKYPFTVLEDPAGDRGRAWLKGVLSEA